MPSHHHRPCPFRQLPGLGLFSGKDRTSGAIPYFFTQNLFAPTPSLLVARRRWKSCIVSSRTGSVGPKAPRPCVSNASLVAGRLILHDSMYFNTGPATLVAYIGSAPSR